MIYGKEERVIEKISSRSGISKEEIEKKIEEKRKKLSGLISREGALQIIAAELGISFDNERFKIDELSPGMKKVNFVGKVLWVSPIRTFKKNDREGKVVNLTVADDTSNIKVVLWDTHHIELVEKGEVSEGVSVEIINGSVRDNEVHLGSFSEFKTSDVSFENVVSEKVVKEKKISELKVSESVEVRAFIVQTFDLRFFNVCPECRKKVSSEGEEFKCAEHGTVSPEKRGLITLILDDGSESIRAVVFHDTLSLLGFSDIHNTEEVSRRRAELLGEEFIFSGNVRMNNYFNNKEFIVNGIGEIDLDKLIQKLEKNDD